jgi:hypothetical protein
MIIVSVIATTVAVIELKLRMKISIEKIIAETKNYTGEVSLFLSL